METDDFGPTSEQIARLNTEREQAERRAEVRGHITEQLNQLIAFAVEAGEHDHLQSLMVHSTADHRRFYYGQTR